MTAVHWGDPTLLRPVLTSVKQFTKKVMKIDFRWKSRKVTGTFLFSLS